MRILLVEDEERVASVISKGLEAEGYAVDEAHDGARGLELAMAYHYDLVILDIMLPKISGTDVLRDLRRNQSQIPVLILTAKDSTQDKVKHLDKGADDYL